MIPLDGSTSTWAVGILNFALGVVFGCTGSFLFFGRYSHTAKLREELNELKERFSDYRDQVTQHFMRSSELVQEMTQSYRAVYEHLASGARELCGDETETPYLDSTEKVQLADGRQHDGEAGSDDPLGDTPRISDIKIKMASEKTSHASTEHAGHHSP